MLTSTPSPIILSSSKVTLHQGTETSSTMDKIHNLIKYHHLRRPKILFKSIMSGILDVSSHQHGDLVLGWRVDVEGPIETIQ